MVEVVHAAFGARPPLDPPSTASDRDAPRRSRRRCAAGGGVYATVGGRPAGALLVGSTGPGRGDLRPRLGAPRLPAARHRLRDGAPPPRTWPPVQGHRPRRAVRPRGVRRADHLLGAPRLRRRPARRRTASMLGKRPARRRRRARRPTPAATLGRAAGRARAARRPAGPHRRARRGQDDPHPGPRRGPRRRRRRSSRRPSCCPGSTPPRDGRPDPGARRRLPARRPGELDDLDLDLSAPTQRHRRRVGRRAGRAGLARTGWRSTSRCTTPTATTTCARSARCGERWAAVDLACDLHACGSAARG